MRYDTLPFSPALRCIPPHYFLSPGVLIPDFRIFVGFSMLFL